MTVLLECALQYAGKGWPVFPLEPGGKRPLGRLAPKGLHNATTDRECIERWWNTAPDANIGIRTGIAFDALDVDGPEALDALRDAMPLAGDPADDPNIFGPMVATPRGWHAYVVATGRGNTVNVGGLPGIDWRGRGGYVVAPGSLKTGGGGWDWVCGPDDPQYGIDAPIRPAPEWVLALFDQRRATHPAPAPGVAPPNRQDRDSAYARAALEREIGRLAMAPEGSRNHALNAAAFNLGTLVGAGLLDTRTVVEHLHVAAQRVGLDDAEAIPTIRSGLAAGVAQPRTRSAA